MRIDYEAYQRDLVAHGVSPDRALASAEEVRAIEPYLDRLLCPECGGRVFRVVAIEVDGIFATYMCSGCKVFLACIPEAGFGSA